MIENSKLEYIKASITQAESIKQIIDLKVYGVLSAFSLRFKLDDALSYFDIDKDSFIANIDNLPIAIGADSEALDVLDDEDREDIISDIRKERELLKERIKSEL